MTDGGPAFPTLEALRTNYANEPDYRAESAGGMSLRDYFAAKAMHAEIVTTWSDATPESAQAFAQACEETGRTPEQLLAFNAYRIADAMLAEREKTEQK